MGEVEVALVEGYSIMGGTEVSLSFRCPVMLWTEVTLALGDPVVWKMEVAWTWGSSWGMLWGDENLWVLWPQGLGPTEVLSPHDLHSRETLGVISHGRQATGWP